MMVEMATSEVETVAVAAGAAAVAAGGAHCKVVVE